MVGTGHPQRSTFASLVLTSNVLLRCLRFLTVLPFFARNLFCDDVSRKKLLFLWSENSGSSFPSLSLGELERLRLGSELLDILRACLGPSLSLRLLLLLGVPDSECREASSKLRRAFTALSFSWCTFSAMIGRI
ncbi:hypothetical protein Tco_1422595 [Tanacetum coccineum]